MNRQKQILSLFLALALAFSLLPMTALAAGGTLAGEGTAEQPYLIADAQDLSAFRDLANTAATKSICGKLTANIDLKQEAWTPISPSSGYVTDAYAGTFDGDGHTIKGLNIHSTASNQGLFGLINGATIRNLQVEGSVASSNSYVGGIVGKAQSGTVENCSFSGTVTSSKASGAYAGGIVGGTQNLSAVRGCAVKGTISGYAGGMVGYGKVTMENCYNAAAIQGTTRAGGMIGQVNRTGTIKNCYNIGALSVIDTEYGKTGGISGFNGTVSNCYYLQGTAAVGNKEDSSLADVGTITDSQADKSSLLLNLGAAFTSDTANRNAGYPILAWQAGMAVVKNPHIEISGAATLYMTNGGEIPQTTLTVNYVDMDGTPPVTWSIKNNSDVITLEKPQNAAASNNTVIVKANKPGKAAVVAEAGAGESRYSAEYECSAVPFVTTVAIENVSAPGAVAIGQTVQAKVCVLGGGAYDVQNYPALTYQWYHGTTPISGAVGSTYPIPKDNSFQEWDKLGVTVKCAGREVHSYRDQQASVRSSDYGTLYPVAYDEAFTLPADLKTDGNLTLPTDHTKDNVTARITWSSSNADVIAESGMVTRPATGTADVTLTAKFTDGTAFANRTFVLKVWSQAAVTEEANNKQLQLETAVSSLGDWYKLYPVYGKDTNVVNMVKGDLAQKSHTDLAVSVKAVEEVNGGGGIADDGAITYFYADPNTAPTLKFGSYKVTFTFTKDGASVDKTVPVIVCWDRDKIKSTMTGEILDKVNADAIKGENTDLDHAASNLTLPKVMDGKKWTLITWTSSNENVLSISSQNQQTADTGFNPYVGVVKPGITDQTVTLTAVFTFQYTNDLTGREEPLTLSQTYSVTVPAMSTNQADKIRSGLMAKLNVGFTAAGLTDAVSGETLTPDGDGKYIASHDIRFPTTRDFGVDGKYYPVTITSSNPDVIVALDGNNAARVSVLRPAVGQPEAEATVTVTLHDKETSVTASRQFTVKAPALTQKEIDDELALMSKVKAAYFDGIKGNNQYSDDIITNLQPFQEVYQNENNNLVWVRDSKCRVNHGIVPIPMQGWEELEAWRLFKSSNPAAVTHENLLVTRQANGKAVTLTSCLSSETLGKYGALYQSDPVKYAGYAAMADLYDQPVTASLVVSGTSPARERMTSALDATRTVSKPVTETANVTFTLQSADSTWITTMEVKGLTESATVYDVLKNVLYQKGYTYSAKGGYVQSVTTPQDVTLGELDQGTNSGWMYKVNGILPNVYMSACGLHDGDSIRVFFTRDYTQESGHSGGSASVPPAQPAKPAFTDVSGHWALDDIRTVYQKGLMTGTSDTTFAPDDAMNRAMFATVLCRLAQGKGDGALPFADVPKDTWFHDAAVWAYASGVVQGMEGNFDPYLTVNREQAVTMLYRYAKSIGKAAGETDSLAAYSDHGTVSDWARDAMGWAVRIGLISGRDGALAPKDLLTRAEAATVFVRLTGLTAQ